MTNIDCIMDMLDWTQPIQIQKTGRNLAKDVRCINVFLQPYSKEHGKNVWENCAVILCDRSDEELQPYVDRLLEWLRDMNWPGAELIFERLKKFANLKWLIWVLEESIKEASALNEKMWLLNLQALNEYVMRGDARQ